MGPISRKRCSFKSKGKKKEHKTNPNNVPV
jgi:hypothetical protein